MGADNYKDKSLEQGGDVFVSHRYICEHLHLNQLYVSNKSMRFIDDDRVFNKKNFLQVKGSNFLQLLRVDLQLLHINSIVSLTELRMIYTHLLHDLIILYLLFVLAYFLLLYPLSKYSLIA
jgi:hypothetical protein